MSAVVADPPPVAWRDPRRWFWLTAWSVPLLPWLGWWASHGPLGEWAWWIAPLVLYGLVPVLDHLLGDETSNPPEAAVAQLAGDAHYRRLLLGWLPLHGAALVLGAHVAGQGELGVIGWLGLVATLGLVAGGGINVAHELGHKRDRWAPWLAQLALAPAFYGHFLVEHNRGHHVRVATPEDPASARLGESFWRFLPRTLAGSLRSAWQLEAQRLAREGRGALHWRNQVLQGWAIAGGLFALLVALAGPWALPFLLAQAFYGASTLEAVNYIEHYGLLRQRDASGRYERCAPRHSWNSNRRLSNLLLFQLERHADHHAHPLRPYQALRHFDDSPQLPAGYATLILAAWIPPLWFRLMDPRVLAFYGGDLRRCNRGPLPAG